METSKYRLTIHDAPKMQLSVSGKQNLSQSLGQSSGSMGGTNNYNELHNKPQINYVELIGNRTLEELNIQEANVAPTDPITNLEIESILNNFAI